ncbi:hypothetical protein BDZ97DRAFT_1266200 [Flammula alnicola]|nr:hypothetical protein BDZ97DRAFT_1266200 [Flammula alnicola]
MSSPPTNPSWAFNIASPDSHPFSQSPTSSPESSTESLHRSIYPSGDSYFGNAIYDSPADSDDTDDNLDEDDSDHTDSTLDDVEDRADFGHPLERMPRLKSADHGLHYDPSEDVNLLLRIPTQSSGHVSPSQSVSSRASSSTTYDSGSCDQIIDLLTSSEPDPFMSCGIRNLVMFDPPADFGLQHNLAPSLMVKRLRRSSPELLLLVDVNRPEPRKDPWNAAPHIFRAVEREDYVFLCMQRLSEYNQPPFINVAHYIDFFRQGLCFLHEQCIAGLSCAEPSSYMVDLNSAPASTAPPFADLPENETRTPDVQFDRMSYPVRYYFVNFTNAVRVRKESLYPSSSPSTPSGVLLARAACPFKQDVQDCGAMFNSLLINVPQIAPKLSSLTKAMIMGGFTADDSRRLLDALCRALDAKVFETTASAPPQTSQPERAHTISHPTPKFPKTQAALEKVNSR